MGFRGGKKSTNKFQFLGCHEMRKLEGGAPEKGGPWEGPGPPKGGVEGGGRGSKGTLSGGGKGIPPPRRTSQATEEENLN